MDIELMDALRRYSACQAADAFDKLKTKATCPTSFCCRRTLITGWREKPIRFR